VGGTQDESVVSGTWLVMCVSICVWMGGGVLWVARMMCPAHMPHDPRPAYLIHSKERLPHLLDLSRAHGERDRLQGDSLRHKGRG
jgi:hypothetical protein